MTAAATRTTAGAAGPDAAALVSAHLAMLAGSYLTEIISGPGRARYAFSAGIPDVTLNFAVGLGAGDIGWLEETAQSRGRSPAFLTDGEAALGWLSGARAYPARWMVAEAAPVARDDLALAGLVLAMTDGPAPDASFLAVFGACHDGGPIDAHVARYYVPVLAAAQPVAGVATRHAVVFDGQDPVACATLHVAGPLAGLYNVGTRHTRQRGGIGLKLTRRLVAEAARLGARHVVLQCAAGTHLERLYGRAGFRTAFSPLLVCREGAG